MLRSRAKRRKKSTLKKHYKKAAELSGSQLSIAFRRFRKNKAGLFGLTISAIVVFVAIFANVLAPFDPLDPIALETNYSPFYKPPGVYEGPVFAETLANVFFTDGSFETDFIIGGWSPVLGWDRVNLTDIGIQPLFGIYAARCGLDINQLSYDLSSNQDLYYDRLDFSIYMNGSSPTTLFIVLTDENNVETQIDIYIEEENSWISESIDLSVQNLISVSFEKDVGGSDIIIDRVYINGGTPFKHTHLMGTNFKSEDLFSKIIHGSRVTLIVSVGAILISLLIGVPLGLVAGYYRGKVDDVIMRFTDIFMTLPFYFTMIFVIMLLQNTRWLEILLRELHLSAQALLVALTVGLGVFGWMGITRLIRATIMQIREMDYVEAARALGASNRRIMIIHILPNVLAPLIVVVTVAMAVNILGEAGLAFLGFTDDSLSSWGRELQSGLEIAAVAWWPIVFPAIVITITVMAFNMIGDGLRDAFDPRLR